MVIGVRHSRQSAVALVMEQEVRLRNVGSPVGDEQVQDDRRGRSPPTTHRRRGRRRSPTNRRPQRSSGRTSRRRCCGTARRLKIPVCCWRRPDPASRRCRSRPRRRQRPRGRSVAIGPVVTFENVPSPLLWNKAFLPRRAEVRHEQIEPAVVVIVTPGGGGPHGRFTDQRAAGDLA